MSVMIKGMKLPKSCYDCDLFSGEGFLCPLIIETNYDWSREAMYKYKRVDECPLVEIPTPHGDLVDRDDLIDEINRVTFVKRYDYDVAYNTVTDAETIIEAEVSE